MPLATWIALALAAAPPEGLEELLARADAAWAERDQPGQLDASRAAVEEAKQLAPDDYGVLWRAARVDVWISDDPSLGDGERKQAGKRAWDAAERAMREGPARVEGYLYAALGMGNYALHIGIWRALRDGIEPKFLSRLRRAEAIDPRFLDGTIQVAWGRYYDRLPWPKRDARKSERYYRAALAENPANVRARVYLAELYLSEHHRDRAKEVLDEALAREPGAYDAPEERRMQERAREIRSGLE